MSHPITTESKIDFISNNEIQYLSTSTDFASATQIDIPLPEKPIWIAGIPHKDGTAWAVAFEDGSLNAYVVNKEGFSETEITPNRIPSGMPLIIYSSNGKLFALTTPADASPLTQPVIIETDPFKIAYIATNGDLIISQNGTETHLAVNALPDSRILVDEHNNLLLLSEPTAQYTHGVLGDDIEATGITLVATTPEPKILQKISIPERDVIEGIYPIWADMDNNGEREIIVTLSNAQDGARIVAFSEDGNLLAEGVPVGKGYRWRHQLIAAPFTPTGEKLLAVIRTPHIGGVLEFYRLTGNKLDIVKTIPGISTHTIGSRNLFTAQVGDFNNDSKTEILAPDQSHTHLGIISMDNDAINWLDLNAELITNLAAVNFEDAQISIAGGLSNNTLKIWLP
ncbi:MAG: hypothetical protein GY755_20395 [Chloroflexi bacterium]|nr:hypothetical protein [Chloroflexota bacterium]